MTGTIPGGGGFSRTLIALDELQSKDVITCLELWRALCNGRRFPAWSDIRPSYFKPVLPLLLIGRVIDGGADFETRIAGAVHVQAMNLNPWPKLLSEIDAQLPGYAAVTRPLFKKVIADRAPFAMRSHIRTAFPELPFRISEGVMFPLGPDDETVDHIMIATEYRYVPQL